jgi:hypothetical protein
MLHCINTNQGACASETCLAMNSDCTSVWVREMLFTPLNELVDDILGRHRAINKKEILMFDPILSKGSRVVLMVIQTDNLRYFEMLENIDVTCGGMTVGSLLPINFIDRSHEGKELTWNYPV